MKTWGVVPFFAVSVTDGAAELVTKTIRPFTPLALWLWGDSSTVIESVKVGTQELLSGVVFADVFNPPGDFTSLRRQCSSFTGPPWGIDKRFAQAWFELSETTVGDGLPRVERVDAGTDFVLRVKRGHVRCGAWIGHTHPLDTGAELRTSRPEYAVDFNRWGRPSELLEHGQHSQRSAKDDRAGWARSEAVELLELVIGAGGTLSRELRARAETFAREVRTMPGAECLASAVLDRKRDQVDRLLDLVRLVSVPPSELATEPDKGGHDDLASELARLGLSDVQVHAFRDGTAILVLGVQTSPTVELLSELADGGLSALNRSE